MKQKLLLVLAIALVTLLFVFSGCVRKDGKSPNESTIEITTVDTEQYSEITTSNEINSNRSYINEEDVSSFADEQYKCHLEGDKLIIYKDAPQNPFIILPSHFYDGFCDPNYDCDAYADDNWVVILSDVALGYQKTKILYRSEDAGWQEIGNAMSVCSRVVTGAGFFSESIGFLSYRYTDEIGTPKIYHTTDGGATWKRLSAEMPLEYADLKMTPLSPTFDGTTAIYPIVVHDNYGYIPTIYLQSLDGGLNWKLLK